MGVTVTVFPLIVAVAAFIFDELTVNAPPLSFLLTANVPVAPYVALVGVSIKFPFARFIFTVNAPDTVLYPSLLAL